ncbi:LysR family transcriptional regulator ArgP [Modestobacter sp. SYSU DS0511]
MDLDLGQLRALEATVAAGSLDAAARALHVTPSAVSQRLKALETATGRVLLVRSRPVQVTSSGEAVLRLARQVGLLTAETARELGADRGPVALPIAVNADSLATWVLPALAPLAGEVAFDLRREDQEHTSALLRDGSVMAAITADADPVPGCTVTRLGGMRYRPMATAAVVARWFPEGVTATALTQAPVVVFDRRDDLQHRYLRSRSVDPDGVPAHFVPSSTDYVEAVRLGFGWGMVPPQQEPPGELVALDDAGAVEVLLHWQQWKLRSPALGRVADAVLAAARRVLDQPAGEERRVS